jgi:nucleoside-diphosphate-sugar epimerase
MVESTTSEIVLITGITGFIGSHIGLSLFNEHQERFKIRATVRSLANKNKLEPLRKAYGEERFNSIEFIEADLL